jgi:hypothetical protein
MQETSEPGLFELGMSARAHRGKSAPKLDGKYRKFLLKTPPVAFLVPDPAPAATSSSDREPFVLMLLPKSRTRAAVPEPATAFDVSNTAVDAPSTGPLGAASEITPERPESPDEVTGLIEHLHLVRAATTSDGLVDAFGEGEGAGTLDRALALKAEGNQDYAAGEFPRALRLYSEAIEMLEGAGEDAALATLLCNRSIAYLKHGRADSALADATRAGALGGGRAHFRRAEALCALGRSVEALEAYKAALANGPAGDKCA